jgi:hypothetical protein
MSKDKEIVTKKGFAKINGFLKLKYWIIFLFFACEFKK